MNRFVVFAVVLPTAFIFGVPALLTSIAPTGNSIFMTHLSQIYIGEATFSVAVADTPQLRQRGLSGLPSLPHDRGLFFAFPKDDVYGIWMKDMHFPIDIIWLDEKMQVVDIRENATPESYPEVYRPQKPARYVFEIGAGLSEVSDIKIGTTAIWRSGEAQ